MNKKKLYATAGLVLLFTSIFFLKNRFTGPLYVDENHYLPTAIFFSREIFPSLETLTTYKELNTAIPFILGGWVIRIFGEDIQFLRILTYLTSFSLLIIFVWTSPKKNNRFWLCLSGLMIFPNYYLCSVHYYTDIFAMIAVLAGLVFYIRKMHWAAMLAFIFAVSCRQYMLAFPAAVATYELLRLRPRHFSAFFKLMLTNKTWIYYSLAALSILPWILIWNGFAPAKVMHDQFYDSDKLANYRPGYVIYTLVCIAVYYVIPELIVTRKFSFFITYFRKHPLFFTGLFLAILSILALFTLKQARSPYFDWPYLGYVDYFFVTKMGITGFVKEICFGILALITYMRFTSPLLQLPGILVLFNAILLGRAQLSWDKYSLPLVMILWYLAMFDQYWLPEKGKKPIASTVGTYL